MGGSSGVDGSSRGKLREDAVAHKSARIDGQGHVQEVESSAIEDLVGGDQHIGNGVDQADISKRRAVYDQRGGIATLKVNHAPLGGALSLVHDLVKAAR